MKKEKSLYTQIERFITHIFKSHEYRLWLIYSLIVLVLGLLFVVNVNRHVIYAMDLTSIYTYLYIFYLFIFALVYIWLANIEDIPQSDLKMFILYVIPSLFLVLGFDYPRAFNQMSFTDKMVTTQLSKNENTNRFSSATHLVELYKEVESGKTKLSDKANVYIFYKTSCPLCKVSVPALLKTLTPEEKKKVVFINLDDKGGSALATKMGIKQASTALVYSGGRASYYKMATFDEETGKFSVLEDNIQFIKEVAGR